jgi:hypothetical protein
VNTSPPAITATSNRSSRVARLIACCALGVLAVALLAVGGWALWVDRVDRDHAGFVSTDRLQMSTETFAIVGDLRGDGPAWLYGSTVLGDAMVRVRSQRGNALFVAIARRSDVEGYLAGAGYATIDHFATSAATTHLGRAPSSPQGSSIWAVSRTGAGEITVPWTPRSGDWAIVMMNADAAGGVAVSGSLAAKVPLLPWVAGGALLCGLLVAGVASLLALPLIRGRRTSPPTGEQPNESRTPVTAGTAS